ncbi:uncharacterized protein LOC108106105 [Drosophila eugracilis]|uniref:uncharacterized protein LOC108106105 n=1 Tax=Drosophila eugracilis TaxID=29029 RepID=UPI001BDB3430|nr:uncharacterized protein LOC108106105 [Drosophila eugracilis]
MDEFGVFDYKRPANATAPDSRTSTYRGHRHITDLRLGNKLNARFADKGIYVNDPILSEKLTSECMANYVWKYGNPNTLTNPSLNMKTQYMKPFEEGCLRFIKRKMKPISSVSHDSYVLKELPEEQEIIPIAMPTPVAATKLVIDRSQALYSKYLDPSATTYNLSYVRLSPQDVSASVAAQDNITYWNWKEKMPPPRKVSPEEDPTLCDEGNTHDCPKRRCEFQNLTKRVPHSGMVTEVRANYTDPQFRKVEFDPDVKPVLVHEEVMPFATKSEYAIYGSGDPVIKYV